MGEIKSAKGPVVKLGVVLPIKPDVSTLRALAKAAEELELDSVWAGESYGVDAVSPLAWVAASTTRVRLGTSVMQIAGRTPAATAMTARGMHELSNGRFILGLGVSGPAVVEGWHGQPFGPRPLRRTREYVGIVRAALAGERLEFNGSDYAIPYAPRCSTPLRGMRSMFNDPVDAPVMLAAMGPLNFELATDIADGWLPVLFHPSRWRDAYDPGVLGRARQGFEVVPSVAVSMGSDLPACLDELRPEIAMFVGGMGARGQNFYFDLVCRYGFEDAAAQILERFQSGDRAGAVAAVPDALVDELTLAGPADRVRERLAEWQQSPVTTLALRTNHIDALAVCREAMG